MAMIGRMPTEHDAEADAYSITRVAWIILIGMLIFWIAFVYVIWTVANWLVG